MEQLPCHSQRWVLAQHPKADEKIALDTVFGLESFVISSPGFQHAEDVEKVLVKTKYISNAPGLRVLIEEIPSDRRFAPPVNNIGDTVQISSIVEVISSNRSEYKKGDLLYGNLGWIEYAFVDPQDPTLPMQHLPIGCDPTDFFSLNTESLTAYFGLMKVGRVKSSDKVIVVSAAAGATGSTVCQIAKNALGINCVIGLAGSTEKCQLLKAQCGCDIALNYKDPDFPQKLQDATPNYVDIFFDNVGGTILDHVIQRMAKYGRVISCGSVSLYNSGIEGTLQGISVKSWRLVTTLRLTLQGFIFYDFLDEFAEAQKTLNKWESEGKLHIIKTVYTCGFKDIPKGLEMLFDGDNVGSLVTKLHGGSSGI